MGKSSSSTSSTQKRRPPPVSGTLEQGGNIMSGYLSNRNSTAVYQGPRVADLSGDTQAGQQMLRDSTGANTSQNYLTSLLNSSANIADNPQVQAMRDAIRRQVQATTNATFSSAGTVGGTQNQNVPAKGLADGLAQPLFQAWQTDQANKLTAAQALPASGSRSSRTSWEQDRSPTPTTRTRSTPTCRSSRTNARLRSKPGAKSHRSRRRWASLWNNDRTIEDEAEPEPGLVSFLAER